MWQLQLYWLRLSVLLLKGHYIAFVAKEKEGEEGIQASSHLNAKIWMWWVKWNICALLTLDVIDIILYSCDDDSVTVVDEERVLQAEGWVIDIIKFFVVDLFVVCHCRYLLFYERR